MNLEEFHKQLADVPPCFRVELRNYFLHPTERKACFVEGYISALEAVHLFKIADAVSYWLAVIDRAKGDYALSRKLIVEMDNPPVTTKEQTMNSLNLNVAHPEELPQVLRRAADFFRESHEQLKLAWQDPTAGLVWVKFAQILDRAATSAEKAVERHLHRT